MLPSNVAAMVSDDAPTGQRVASAIWRSCVAMFLVASASVLYSGFRFDGQELVLLCVVSAAFFVVWAPLAIFKAVRRPRGWIRELMNSWLGIVPIEFPLFSRDLKRALFSDGLASLQSSIVGFFVVVAVVAAVFTLFGVGRYLDEARTA